jgi:hypothetical protein
MTVFIVWAVCETILKLGNRIIRHFNIRKVGYPPPHCDADGDFKPKQEE